MKAGASGYLTKDSLPDQLLHAIRLIAKGRKYVSPSLAEALASDLGREAAGMPHELLSDREYQVLCLIASGKAVKAIAEQLLISVKTVSTYRSRILEKMRMRSNAELTRYAIENRLVSRFENGNSIEHCFWYLLHRYDPDWRITTVAWRECQTR